MDPSILQLLVNAPAALACIAVVMLFLRHLKELQDKELKAAAERKVVEDAEAKERRGFVERLSAECHEHSKEMQETTVAAVQESVKVIRECGQAIATNTELLRRVEQNQNERERS